MCTRLLLTRADYVADETYCYPDDDEEVQATRSSTRKRRRRDVSPNASADLGLPSSTVRPKKSHRKERYCSELATIECAQLVRRSIAATSNGDENDAEAVEDIADDVKIQADSEFAIDKDRSWPSKAVIGSNFNSHPSTDNQSISAMPKHYEPLRAPEEPTPLPHGTPCSREMQGQMTVWPAKHICPPNSCDAAHAIGVLHPSDTYHASISGQTFFPGNRDYSFPPQWSPPVQQGMQTQAVQLYQAGSIHRPQLHSVPDAPVLSHSSLLPSGAAPPDLTTGQAVSNDPQPFQWHGVWTEPPAPHLMQAEQQYPYGLLMTDQPPQPVQVGFARPCPTPSMQPAPRHPPQQHAPPQSMQYAVQDTQQLRMVPHGFAG